MATTAELEAQMAQFLADSLEDAKVAERLMAENSGLNFVTAHIMASDLRSKDRAWAVLRANEVPWEKALWMVGSFGRFDFAIETQKAGYATRNELLELLPELWRGSDPNDTDPMYLQLWREAFAQNGNQTVVDGDPLPAGKTIRIFRGQMEGESFGIAWSTNEEIAQRFARGAGARMPQNGIVYRARVQRKKVLAFLTGRGEYEAIVDPGDLLPS